MEMYADKDSMERLKIRKYPQHYLHLPDLPIELVKEGLCFSPVKYLQIPNPSREVTLFLVRRDGYNLSLVSKDNQDEEICLEALRNYGYALESVKIEITEEMCRECVLSFLREANSDVEYYLNFSFLNLVPYEIVIRKSFRRFLIDHGIFTTPDGSLVELGG